MRTCKDVQSCSVRSLNKFPAGTLEEASLQAKLTGGIKFTV